MKTLISYVALTVFILASSFTIGVQENLNRKSTNSCFTHFNVHRQGKGVTTAWTVSSPDVVRFIVERSYDDDYELVGSVNFNGASIYKIIDNNPYPGTAVYRVTAVMADGSTETSAVETVKTVKRG